MNDIDNLLDKLLLEADELKKESDASFDKLEKIKKETLRVQQIASNIDKYLSDIDAEFEARTKLNNVDIRFLVVATSLQVLRQYLLMPKERMNDKDAAKASHEKNQEIFDKYFGNLESENSNSDTYYYAPLNEILDLSNGVPYDVIQGSKKFELGGDNKGLNGNTHRFKTLGHDPILGLYFGTLNILTNTVTTNELKSYHVKRMSDSLGRMKPTVYAKAQTRKLYEAGKKRIIDDKAAVAAALIKQVYHIQSDKNSIKGIPLPAVSYCSDEIAKELADYGFDLANTETYGKQFVYAMLIDMIISMLHRLFYDKNTDGNLEVYKVRTKKILDYSGVIASTSNVIKSSIMYITRKGQDLDVGGIIYTIYKLIKDKEYIREVKREFIICNFEKLIQGDY